MSEMKIIACTGDSHTWGQGAEGVKAYYSAWEPPGVAGEHRMLPLELPTYAELLRAHLRDATGSAAYNLDPTQLSDGLPFEGSLVRLQFRYTPKPCIAQVYIDGAAVWEGELQSSSFSNPYNLIALPCTPGLHTLTVSGTVPYGAEVYAGSHAVVNCGVGSCPVGKYLADYFDRYVTVLRPAVVLMQGHTINDWLTGEGPVRYGELLAEYAARVREIGAQPVFLSVEPILGDRMRGGYDFEDYITESLRVMRALDVPIADAHAGIAAVPGNYEDNWHPGPVGHRIYADLAWEIIKTLL